MDRKTPGPPPPSSRVTQPLRSPGLAKDPLGRVLLKKGLITVDQLEAALKRQRATNEKLGHTLLQLGLVSGMDLVRALGTQHHVAVVPLGDHVMADPRVLSNLHKDVVTRLATVPAVPLIRVEGTLFAAIHEGTENLAKLMRTARELEIEAVAIFVPPAVDLNKLLVDLQASLSGPQRRPGREMRIGEYLISRKLCSPRQVDEALEIQERTGQRIGEILIQRGVMSNEKFYEALGSLLGMPHVSFDHIHDALDPEVARLVNRTFAEHNSILPFAKFSDRIRVVTAGPLDASVERFILNASGARRCEAYLADRDDVQLAINEVYDAAEQQQAAAAAPVDLDVAVEDVSEFDADGLQSAEAFELAPKIVNFMLHRAVERKVSDIHIEHHERRVVTRFRVDGQLVPAAEVPIDKDNIARVVAKLKLDCKLDITERRRPQDGSFRKRFGEDRVVDFRLSVQPTVHGENIVIRILDRTRPLPPLAELGFSKAALERYLRLIESPQGMILFTGPTGSGKTTSLYATLDVLRQAPMKLITAEDPVEYFFDGIEQCQVNETLDNTFARYLRAFLRRDPDVILVGEMRDKETSEIAIRAALTGHLVFSTLHTLDTIATVRRLLDMEIDPDLMATSLLCIVSQRLVRTVCENCKKPHHPAAALVDEFYAPDMLPPDAKLCMGVGCDVCSFTGYSGRAPVFELWEIDEGAQDLIRRNEDEGKLRDHAFKQGMESLVRSALNLVEAGRTTLEELRSSLSYLQIVRQRRESGEQAASLASKAAALRG